MSGLTLYETLRIFVPGAIAIMLLDVTARVSLGASPLTDDGGVADFVNLVESPAIFATLSFLVGLLLYLVDYPTSLRIYRHGDEKRNASVPSSVLQGMLTNEQLRKRSIPLYFLLTDEHLPEEFHRRVYLFGSLYRVYVDLRLLLTLAAVLGVAVALVGASRADNYNPFPQWTIAFAGSVVGILVSIVIVSAVGVLDHRRQWKLRHAGPGDKFRAEVAEEAKEIGVLFSLIALSASLGHLLIAWLDGMFKVLGLAALGLSLVLWGWVEIGPHREQDKGVLLRATLFGRLGIDPKEAQFRPTQRILCDLALFAPTAVFATTAALNNGREPQHLLAWAVFILPATAIMSWRKHEQRLLSNYRDQATWLMLNRERIAELDRTGELPTDWED